MLSVFFYLHGGFLCATDYSWCVLFCYIFCVLFALFVNEWWPVEPLREWVESSACCCYWFAQWLFWSVRSTVSRKRCRLVAGFFNVLVRQCRFGQWMGPWDALIFAIWLQGFLNSARLYGLGLNPFRFGLYGLTFCTPSSWVWTQYDCNLFCIKKF